MYNARLIIPRSSILHRYITMARFYLCTALLVAIVATYSSPSTVATAMETTAGDEFLAELDQVEEDSGKKPRRVRELNHEYHGWPTKKPTKKPWGWKPPTKKPTKKPYYHSGWNY